MKLPFELTKKNIAFILSLLLNLLSVTGTVEPLVGAPPTTCPPMKTVTAPPSLAPSPPPTHPAEN